MKKLFFFLLTFVTLQVRAIDDYNVRVHGNSYSCVDTLHVSPDVAYNNAQNWIITSSNNYKSSVQYENLEQKKIIAKSTIPFPYKRADNEDNYIAFVITLEIKEGRYRIKIDNIKCLMILDYSGLNQIFSDDSEVVESDIITCSGYKKNPETGLDYFYHEEDYNKTKSELLEYESKLKVAKKKKEISEINSKIDMLKSKLSFFDKEREKYLVINTTINNYIKLLKKQINFDDSF